MLEQLLQSLDVISIAVFIIFFVLIGYRPPWWWRKNIHLSKGCSSIPGPFSLPFFGTGWLFIVGGYKCNKMHEFYEDMYKKYGPVMKEEALNNIPVISLFDRRDIEKVLKTGGRYPLRPPTEAIAYYRKTRSDRYVTTGIVNEQGEAWHFLRTSLTPDLMSPKTINTFLPEMEQITADWCSLLKQVRCKNSHIVHNLEQAGSNLGLEAMCALVLGRRMGFLLPNCESVVCKKLAFAVHQHFIACRDTSFGLGLWKLFPTPSYKNLVESEEEIYSLALELIESADDATKESAVFQSVLKANIDEREKTAAIVDFIAAGIHTLNNSLIFLLYLIGSHPDVQEKLYHEILKSDTAYLKACVMESFRMLPTANCLARITGEDMELGGHRLKAGSVIVCHTGLACKDDRNFHRASEFRPERWLDDEKADTMAAATYLVIPFGVGRRTCPGKRFIEQMLPIVVRETVKNYIIRCDKPLEVEFEFLLAPKIPVSMSFIDRH